MQVENREGAEPKPGGGRPNGSRANEIAFAILDAAMEEFTERGFHGASIASIAARAGVTRVTVYKRFGSKDELLWQLSQHRAARLGELLARAIDWDRDVADVLRDVGRTFWNSSESRVISRLLVMESTREPEIVRQGHALRWKSLEPLVSYLERLAPDGTISIDDPARAAEQFMHLATGTLDFLFGDEGRSDADREAWILAAVRLFLYGARRDSGDRRRASPIAGGTPQHAPHSNLVQP